MFKNILIIFICAFIFSGCANSPQSAEPWIDYSGVSKIDTRKCGLKIRRTLAHIK